MEFEECCIKCMADKELVTQFNRLTGLSLGVARSPIEIAIDKSCGINPKESIPQFVKFVYDYVWIPLLVTTR